MSPTSEFMADGWVSPDSLLSGTRLSYGASTVARTSDRGLVAEVQTIFHRSVRGSQSGFPLLTPIMETYDGPAWMLISTSFFLQPQAPGSHRVCFITAGPITKLCAWGEEESGGHVL